MASEARGSSSSGASGLSVANSGEMCMWGMGVPLSRCAFAKWKEHVSGHHSTRYGVVRLGLVVLRGCFVVLVVEYGLLGFGG